MNTSTSVVVQVHRVELCVCTITIIFILCLRVKGTPTPDQTSKTQPLSSCYRQICPIWVLLHSTVAPWLILVKIWLERLNQNFCHNANIKFKCWVYTGAVHCRLGLLQHASEHKLKQNLSQLPSSLFTGILNRCMICFWLTYPTYRTGIDHSFYFIFQISIDHSECGIFVRHHSLNIFMQSTMQIHCWCHRKQRILDFFNIATLCLCSNNSFISLCLEVFTLTVYTFWRKIQYKRRCGVCSKKMFGVSGQHAVAIRGSVYPLQRASERKLEQNPSQFRSIKLHFTESGNGILNRCIL